MKKLSIRLLSSLIIFLPFHSSMVLAQESEVLIRTVEPDKRSRVLSFGLKGGANIAWIRSDTKGYENDGIKMGLNYGLITDFSLANNDNYFISTGVVVSNIGGKMNNPSVMTQSDTSGNFLIPSTKSVNYSIRQLEIPISLKMKTAEIGYIRYYGQFGVTPGFALRLNQEGSENFVGGSAALDESNADDYLLAFRMGVLAGAGIEYNLTGNTNLMIGITYNGAFTNALKGQTSAGSDERRGFEVDANGQTDVSKVNLGGPPYTVTSGPALISRADYVALNVAIFF